MELTLSVFFSNDRVYLAVVEPTPHGLSLAHINSTQLAVDLENPDSEESIKAAENLRLILQEEGDIISSINITLPSDVVLVSQFPGNHNISGDEVRQLLNLEIRQSFPQFNTNDFSSSVYVLAPRIDGTEMLMAVIIPKTVYQTAKSLVNHLKAPIHKVEISQLNANTAFLYNYPEQSDKTVVLLGVQNQFVDISVLKEGKPVYFNLASLPDINDIGRLCEKEFDRIMADYAEFIDAAYFFGPGLTKETLEIAKSSIEGMVMSYGKLNAFRMMRTDLDQRYREYCSRVAHIFPPCIGGCMPAYTRRLKII